MRRVSDAFYDAAYDISLIPTKVEVGIKNMKAKKSKASEEKQEEGDYLDAFMNEIRQQVAEEKKVAAAAKEARKNGKREKSPERILGEEIGKKQYDERTKNRTDNIDEVLEYLDRRYSNETIDKAKEVGKNLEKANNPALGKATVTSISKVDESKKWLYYALYYITDANAEKLDGLSKNQKAFVNGIAAAFGINIYDDVKPADIRLYDPNSNLYNEYGRFEISIESEITPLLGNEEFMKKVAARKEQLYPSKTSKQKVVEQHKTEEKVEVVEESTAEEVVKEEKEMDVIHPVSFDNLTAENNKKKAEKLPTKLFKKLENVFVPMIGKKNHKYEQDGDLVNLYYNGNKFVVDPGVCMGRGKVYVMGNIPNNTVFISTEHKDLVKKILSDKNYMLTEDDMKMVVKDYFPNMLVYRYIDMNNTPYLGKLSYEEMKKLGDKLMFIINQEKATNQEFCIDIEIPRFRFNSFESVDKFSLISDKLVKSPLSSTGETSSLIADGVTITVEGNKMTKVLGDSKYTIEMK